MCRHATTVCRSSTPTSHPTAQPPAPCVTPCHACACGPHLLAQLPLVLLLARIQAQLQFQQVQTRLPGALTQALCQHQEPAPSTMQALPVSLSLPAQAAHQVPPLQSSPPPAPPVWLPAQVPTATRQRGTRPVASAGPRARPTSRAACATTPWPQAARWWSCPVATASMRTACCPGWRA